MICGCGKIIEPARVALGYKYCLSCAQSFGAPKVRGRMVYEHKTAGYIEIMSPSSFRDNKKFFNRSGNRSVLKQV